MFSRVFLLAVRDPSPYGFDRQCEKNPQLIPTTSTSSTKYVRLLRSKLHEAQRRISEVTLYPAISSV